MGADPDERTIFVDPDFRRNPKTWHFCYVCQRDLNPDKPYRMIAVDDMDPLSAVHPDCAGTHKRHPIGADCARRIGLEWTSAPTPAEVDAGHADATPRKRADPRNVRCGE